MYVGIDFGIGVFDWMVDVGGRDVLAEEIVVVVDGPQLMRRNDKIKVNEIRADWWFILSPLFLGAR